jgi:hypothetical protein
MLFGSFYLLQFIDEVIKLLFSKMKKANKKKTKKQKNGK